LAVRAASVLLALSAAALASAQEPVDPGETARFRLGPLRFTPAIAVTNLGIDDNVFNESVNPKRDTTATFGPAVDVWTRLGKARVTAKSTGQYLFFKTYDNQRGWTTANDVRVDLPLARVKPFVGGAYIDARERPGFEIDSRARRRDRALRIGTEWRASGKSAFIFSAETMDMAFDDDEMFLGANLATQLNRVSRTERIQVRQTLTPLTTFVVTADAMQDRFERSPVRDTDSVRIMSGLELKPFALISGKIFVGARRFDLRDSDVPDFNGLVASVDATYAIRSTQFTAKVSRDIAYSFEVQQPYYTLTDSVIGVTQRITSKWDVVGRVGRQSLAYRNLETLPALLKRTDHAVLYGGGIGYRLGETLRFGVDVNNYRRDAPSAELRDYSGLRAGASISYGLPQ
jgi:hypothetical protein